MAVASTVQRVTHTSPLPGSLQFNQDAGSGNMYQIVSWKNPSNVKRRTERVAVAKEASRRNAFAGSPSGLRLNSGSLRTSTGSWQDVIQSLQYVDMRKGGALAAEMNIFSRISRIIRSFVETLLGSGEDPEKIIEQAVQEMTADVLKFRQTTALVVASQKTAEKKYKDAAEASGLWYKRAARALEAGEEDLAKEALRRRKTCEENIRVLKSQLDQQTAVLDKMMTSTMALERKISEARSKKDLLKSRAQTAKTSKYVAEVLGSVETRSAMAAYRQMEEKVEKLEAEAAATTQLGIDDLSTKFDKLEEDSNVNDDLDTLKREILSRPRFQWQEAEKVAPWERDFERSSGGY